MHRFATLINAGGFLALAMSGLPPMRQFGIISACAFALSMLSSLTALPASGRVTGGSQDGADDAMTARRRGCYHPGGDRRR